MAIKYTRKRVLLSCFACSPIWGSEPGVGWRWLIELAKRHDVELVTHAYFREHLEPALSKNPIFGLVKVHYIAPTAFGAHPHKQLNSRLYYIWWQWHVGVYVKKLLRTHSFDLFHHLTWCTFRFPTFLGRKGVPLVMGPLGGGEVAPLRFYEDLPLLAQAKELLRYFSLHFAKYDPLAMWGPKASVLVFCVTEDTLNVFPKVLKSRTVIAPVIGSPLVDLTSNQNKLELSSPFRLLFAGTLTGVKGIVLVLEAVHLLNKTGYKVTLDIAGKGDLRQHILREVARLGLSEQVNLLGMIPREELMELYGKSDLFVFPSLHDSSGMVVLESLSRGLPVICLDLGGPKYYVTPQCGIVVSTQNKSRAQVEQAMADEIAALINEPERLRSMSKEAIRQANIQTWESRVNNVYDQIEQKLNWYST